MTVTRTPSNNSTGGTNWIRLSGTIQEVLDTLSAENASAINVPYWFDDGTDAKALMCRQE